MRRERIALVLPPKSALNGGNFGNLSIIKYFFIVNLLLSQTAFIPFANQSRRW